MVNPDGNARGFGPVDDWQMPGSLYRKPSRNKPPIDPPSPHWLGLRADRAEIRESGLWNVNYVDQPYDSSFIELLDRHVAAKVVAR